MSIQSEQEFKTLLTATQADLLQNSYPFQQAFTQTNRYYDTADGDLRHQGWGLRTRQFADHSEQTLKIPAGPHRQLLEYTDPITDLTLAPGGTVAAQLAAANIPLDRLHQFAEATTIRRTAPLPAGLLTLDQTQYPNGATDWEAELEYQNYPVALAFWQALQQRFAWSTSIPENKVQRAKQNVN